MVPFSILEVLGESTDTIPFDKLIDLHIVLRMDTLDEDESFGDGSHALARFLGKASNLQTLTLVYSDDNEMIQPEQHFNYLASWRFLHSSLIKTTFPRLEILRLQDFRAPDHLLLQFIVKYASSLRKVDLTGCFVGYGILRGSEVSSLEWGPSYEGDNFRGMLESLQGQTKLDEFRVRFSSGEGPLDYALWEDSDAWSNFDWRAISKDMIMRGAFHYDDHFLLSSFLRSLCP